MNDPAEKESALPDAGAFSWNLVTEGCEPGAALIDELRSRIGRLSRLLERLPPEQVHLLVSLAQGEEPRFKTRLDLKLPTTVLHAEDKGGDQPETLRHSFFVLEQQVEALTADLRGERRWKRGRRVLPGQTSRRTLGFGEPKKKGPQTQRDLLRNFVFRHYHRLLLHATRRVAELVDEANLLTGSIDPQEVLDEVVRICLEHPERKPSALTYELWLFQLIREELDREFQDLAKTFRERAEFPVGDFQNGEELTERAAGALAFESDESLDEEHFADPTSLPPDLLLEESDLVAEIMRRVRYWHKQDREIFTLHFLEGFDAEETAMLVKMEVAQVEQAIRKLQLRLRHILREAAK